MSEKDILAFMDDDAFIEKFFAVDTPEEAQLLFKENGLELSLEEVNKIGEKIKEELEKDLVTQGELSDDDMTNVAGGFWQKVGLFIGEKVVGQIGKRGVKKVWNVTKEYVQDTIDSFERFKRQREVDNLQGAPRFDYLKDVK